MSKIEDASNKARQKELDAYSKIVSGELKEGTTEWEEAYEDYSRKYYERERIEHQEELGWFVGGCLKYLIIFGIIGYVFYWVVKGLFSIKTGW